MQRFIMKLVCISLGFALVSLLQGCMDVAMTGAQAVYNHRTIQKSINDQHKTMVAYKAIQQDRRLSENTNIAITTYNGEMLITGQVPESWQRDALEDRIKRLPEVKEVYNLVRVAGPSSALTRISDAWITAKVKGRLIVAKELDARQIKVVTENGTVYLMGILRPTEAREAVALARETDGVRKVVKIFSYMHISKNEHEASRGPMPTG